MSALVSLHSKSGERDEEIPRFGQKGAWLRWLAAAGERVPEGFVVPAELATRLRDRDPSGVADLQIALADLAGQGALLAVRASPVYSLPGALLTVLDLTVPDLTVGEDHEALTARVLHAIDRVLQSATQPAARDQLAARGIEPGPAPWLALVVQRMASVAHAADFGAVAFTHDPARGVAGLCGEWALGQATRVVVSGRARPEPLTRAASRPGREGACLEVAQPQAFAQLHELCARLTQRAEEPLELELVMADGVLWIVQARPLVLAVRGMLQVALDALREQRASAIRLLRRISPKDLSLLVEARLPEPAKLAHVPVIARGLAASPGVASGRLVFDLKQALQRSALEPVVLVRRDALPEDVAAFRAARAIITTSGGLTSHAAVIARGLRIPAAIGCAEVRLDAKAGCLVRTSELGTGEILGREGDLVTVDGYRGIVYAGAVPSMQVVAPELRTLCAALQPRRRVALLALGPSSAAQRAHEECALDGIWDAQAAAYVCGPARVLAVHVVGDFATDSLQFGQSLPEALACPPEQAESWVLWLGSLG